MTKTVLTIAGSDPTGGAGIQADLKTLTVLGVYGAAVPSCITVQNSLGVSRIVPLDPDLVGAQIDAVLADHQVTVIKIGMIATSAVGEAIISRLEPFGGQVIVDPVLVSSTGQSLLEGSAENNEVYSRLIRYATLVTPNLPELAALTNMPTGDDAGIIKAACHLLRQPGSRLRGVVATGGDAGTDTLTDYLVINDQNDPAVAKHSHARIRTKNSHGTGCTLSSALAAHIMLGLDPVSAFQRSVDFLQELLLAGSRCELIKNSEGNGPLTHHLRHG